MARPFADHISYNAAKRDWFICLFSVVTVPFCVSRFSFLVHCWVTAPKILVFRFLWGLKEAAANYVDNTCNVQQKTRTSLSHWEQRSQQCPKKIQDILQDIWKNTGHLTRLQKPISLHLLGIIVSRQYSESSDVGIYQAGTLHPEIIVTLFTQKQISHCYVRQLCISEHTTLSYSGQKPTAANIF